MIAGYAIWLWNAISYIMEGTQAKSMWKQDPETKLLAQKGGEWGVEKVYSEEFHSMGD